MCYFSFCALGNCPHLTSEEDGEGTGATNPALLLGKSVMEGSLVARGEGDLLMDGRQTVGVMGHQCPQTTGWRSQQTHSSSVSHLTCSWWLMTWEWALWEQFPLQLWQCKAFWNPGSGRTRGSGCNPNSENISLLTALNPDSDMGTTLETISKKRWLASNYMNFNRQVKENRIPLRFLKKYFIHPF